MILSIKNRKYLLTTLLLLVGCAPKENAGQVTAPSADKIINGTLVSDGDAIQRSTAFVYTWNQTTGEVYICSSSLISKNLIVTAAHCLVDDNSVRLSDAFQTYVAFKTTLKLNDPSYLDGAIVIPAGQIMVNPKYKKGDASDSADIALIKLPDDAPAGQVPVPILKDAGVLTTPNTSVVVAGYGISTADGSVEAKTGVYSLRSMTSFIEQGYTNMPDVIPIADWGATLGTGEGDSGGPALVTVAGKTYLFGACSAGNDHETFYTSLIGQMDWLKASATALQADTNF